MPKAALILLRMPSRKTVMFFLEGLMTFLKAGNGLLQLRMENQEGGCLLAFSNPLRASDYAREAAPEQSFEYFCSSPKQVVSVMQHFVEYAGVTHVALDRCPRCNVFCT